MDSITVHVTGSSRSELYDKALMAAAEYFSMSPGHPCPFDYLKVGPIQAQRPKGAKVFRADIVVTVKEHDGPA